MRGAATFTDKRYPRAHVWRFDGGIQVPASSAPDVVPAPLSDPAAVDPEEAFVASLSSCHMLWFLALAAARGHVIDRYRDAAIGVLAKDADGGMSISRVTLRPEVRIVGANRPSADDAAALHRAAHARCFIARSVRCEVVCDPAPIEFGE